MPGRKDALTAAAELILALEAAAKSTGAIDTVGTVGVCEVFPGAVNSIPSRVRLETDIRDIDDVRRDAVIDKLKASCREVAERRGVSIKTEMVNADPPATCDPATLEAMEQAAQAAGKSYRRMVSARLSRLALHGAHRSRRHALHSLPWRGEPSPRRIRIARMDWQRRSCARTHTCDLEFIALRLSKFLAPMYAMRQPVRRFALPQP